MYTLETFERKHNFMINVETYESYNGTLVECHELATLYAWLNKLRKSQGIALYEIELSRPDGTLVKYYEID